MQKIYENINFNWTGDSDRLILTPGLFAKNNLFYIQEIGNFSTLPDYSAEREGLDSQLIVLTLSGTGSLEYEGNTYETEEGTFFWIDCETRHRYKNVRNWHFLWIHFNGSGSKGLYRAWRKSHGPVAPAHKDMRSALFSLLTYGKMPSPAGELESSCIIDRMLTDILLTDYTAPFAADSAPQYLNDVLRYLDLHFREEITLQVLSDTFHINAFYLSREFKAYLGVGYREYLIRRRVGYTKDLLRHTEKTVEEIAELAGFPSSSYFISVFKKAEGVTPLQFRKSTQM